MTKNQIEYVKHLEQSRANRTQERLTAMRDLAARRLGFANLEETRRSNQAREQFNQGSLDETVRSNLSREAIQRAQNQETVRSNLAREQLTAESQAETHRSNIVREGQTERQLTEQERTNLANELIRQQANRIQAQNVANQYAVGMANVAEMIRSHQVSETQRAQEIDISGKRQVADQAYQTGQLLGQSMARVETMRHNLQMEQVSRSQARSQEKQAQASLSQAETAQHRADTQRGQAISSEVRSWIKTPGEMISEGTSSFRNVTQGLANIVKMF